MKRKKVKTCLKKLSPILFEMIDENIDVEIIVTGNSMNPLLIYGRDSVLLTRCDKFNLKKGDIPLYMRSNGKYVLHRIVRVNENSYDLCGDNQYVVEKNLPKKNVVSVVKSFKRNGQFYDCNNFIYKIYWHLRIFSIPFRSFLYRTFGKIRRMF